MTALLKYDAACRALTRYEALKAALAEALTVDEVKDFRDKAEAMRAYAKMANDVQLELDAAEYRIKAERRLGELMAGQSQAGLLSDGGRPRKTGSESDPVSKPITLAQVGIDKHLADRARRLAAMPEEVFGAGIKRVRDRISTGKRVSLDIAAIDEKDKAESRRQLARELSDATALSPTGRKFPVVYADPAYRRKAGIGNRSYENHYPTNAWDEILAMPVAQRVLPDAWLYLWIPRAHLLALHPTEIDTPLGRTKVKLPLAWAVAQAWGFDAYSTCFIWTKTDEKLPDDHGLGLIVWDQDEVLCLFKRGRGLPKPGTDVKVGSNHRERAGAHSAKPAYYRDMINAMTGGVPVLELFAREDDGNPLPANFFTWGNQSKNTAELPPHDPETGESQQIQNHSHGGEYSPPLMSNTQAAKLAGVDATMIKDAKTVVTHGTAEEIRAVREGGIAGRDVGPAGADTPTPQPPAPAPIADDPFNEIPPFLRIGDAECSWRSPLE